MFLALFQPRMKKAIAEEDRDAGEELNEARVEPVARLALVEHHLQRADGEHEQHEPRPIGLQDRMSRRGN